MNGKEYVTEAMGLVRPLAAEIRAWEMLEGDPLPEELVKACEDLGQCRNKATLRTKAGANIAFPVYDAAKKLEEEWEEAREGDDPDDLKYQMGEFIGVVEVLTETLKKRTVIMT